MNDKSLVDQIIEVLPQLQCKKCEYPDCRSYAQSLIEKKEKTNKCEPGGLKTENHIKAILAGETHRSTQQIKNYEVEKLETITIHYLLKLSVFVQ